MFAVSPIGVVAALAIGHVVVWRLGRRQAPWQAWLLCAALCGDLLGLHALVQHYGGAHNPFTILTIVIGSVAAMYLPRRMLAVVLATALLILGSIYRGSAPMDMQMMHDPRVFSEHLRGMWIANSLGVIVVCWWIFRLRAQNAAMALRQRATERMIADLERIDSMGRMVAATAHTLNTPLATLQLGIDELAAPLEPADRTQWLADMQSAVTRIRDVVRGLAPQPDAQRAAASAGTRRDLALWLDALCERWSAARLCAVDRRLDIAGVTLPAGACEALAPVLEAVLENAAAAAVPERALQIACAATLRAQRVTICVRDTGSGMDAVTRARATEPLFTTKQHGTGLGLYLGHQLMQRWHGRLQIESTVGIGTTVTLEWPREVLS